MKKHSYKEYSVCITTHFDKNFEKIGKLSLIGMKKYAKKYGFDIRLFNEIKSNRPPAWNKILITQRLLNDPKKYDFIYWIDSDTLFFRFDEDIRQEIEPDKDFYLVKTNYPGFDIPLTGAFLIRNSEWSKKFLKDTWNLKKYTYHNWWENAAVDELLGFKDIIDYRPWKLFISGILYRLKLKNIATKILSKVKYFFKINNRSRLKKKSQENFSQDKKYKHNLKKVKWLDLKWDSLIKLDEHPNPIIQHYPAMSFEERLKKMTKDFEKIKRK
ncbi:MAG: hypothetical protein WC584_00105 [Candidatus Pacearchaeota archaeon]